MSTAVPHLVDEQDVRRRVDSLLQTHLDRLEAELAEIGPEAAPLVDALRAMLGGGKRLRAAFAYWSWRAHGGVAGSPDELCALRVGAALELFQAAALFHDDVMDDSDTRRGHPTAHRAFARRHADHGLAGDADRYGSSAAILLGDLALVACDAELTEAVEPLPAPRAAAARAVFARMTTGVTVGQYLDLEAQVQPWGDEPARIERRAWQVLRAKSARYSVEQPMVLGAVVAGADAAALARCAAIGLPLGEAFQLRDDLLGVFGDPAVTGKPAGDDLREGKRTVLVARALAAGDDEVRRLLTEQLGDPALDASRIAALAAAVAASGAADQVEGLIDDLSARAAALIESSGWPEPARGMLLRLGRQAVDRRR